MGLLVEEQDAAAGAVLFFQRFFSVVRIPLAGQGAGQDFRGQGVGQGLAVALADSASQVVSPIHDVAAHHGDMASPFLERFGRPDRLGFSGFAHDLRQFGQIGFIQLRHGGAGGRVGIQYGLAVEFFLRGHVRTSPSRQVARAACGQFRGGQCLAPGKAHR